MEENERTKHYLEERKSYIELLKYSTDQFDKNLLYVTTGALFISLTFIEKIVPQPMKSTMDKLGYSWTLLVICIICILLSFYSSIRACSAEIENLDRKYAGEKVFDNNIWSNLTSAFNLVAICLLIAGIIFQVIFIYVNIANKAV